MIPPQTVDITLITGEEVMGRPTSWQRQQGFFKFEDIAVVNINSDLIHFSRSELHDWQAVNVSTQTGKKIKGGLTNWWTSRISSDRHLAGRDPTGDLIVSESTTGSTTWYASNVSTMTGKKVLTSPTSWLNSDLGSENLAALGNTGQLLVFSRRSPRDWEVVDVTAKTGKTVIGELISWVSPNGSMFHDMVEHVAGVSSDGSLVEFWRSYAHDWQAVNVSEIAGGLAIPGAPLLSWTRNDLNRQYIAVLGQNNRLYVYWRISDSHWGIEDVTATTGIQITGLGTTYQIPDDNVTVLTSGGTDGSFLQFWYSSWLGWQALNFSQATDSIWSPLSTAWITDRGDAFIENVATVTPQRHLILTSDYGMIHRLTDSCSGRRFQQMMGQLGRRQLVAILWDPHRLTDPAPPVAAMDNLIFGQTNSVRHYFLENSRGKFTIERAGVHGWFPASRPPDYWWGPPDTTDADGDGWINPHVQKWAEAIRQADPQFNYKAYDKSPYDGDLRPDELGILIIIPQNVPFGTNRGAVGREFPNPQPLVVDGVTIGTIAEVYIGNPPNLGVVAHELTHLFLHHGDMYFTFFNPYAAGHYSLMDGTYKGTHIDPFAKLKFGWLRPQLIVRSGHYSLPSIETGYFVWILMDPAHSIAEYFIVENRWRGNSFDKQMPDAGGLAIWHIMEDPVVFGSVPPPPGVTAQQWSTVGTGDGARRAIRMLRPLVVPPFDDTIALRDGADPITGFDVLSNDPDPKHSSLKWANGTPSGFAIRNISPAGEVMTADIIVSI